MITKEIIGTKGKLDGRIIRTVRYNDVQEFYHTLNEQGRYMVKSKSNDSFYTGQNAKMFGSGPEQMDQIKSGIMKPELIGRIMNEYESAKVTSIAGRRMRRRKTFNEFDGEVDVDKVLGGDQMVYRRKSKVTANSRLIKIFLEFGINGDFDVDLYFSRMARIIMLAHQMSTLGYTIEICGLEVSRGNFQQDDGILLLPIIPLKGAYDFFDLHRIMITILPTFFRCCVFEFYGKNAAKLFNSPIDTGLGSATSDMLAAKTIKEVEGEDVKGVMYKVDHDSYIDLHTLERIEERDINSIL